MGIGVAAIVFFIAGFLIGFFPARSGGAARVKKRSYCSEMGCWKKLSASPNCAAQRA